jgi:hypothetical protein
MDNRRLIVGLFTFVLVGIVAGVVYMAAPRQGGPAPARQDPPKQDDLPRNQDFVVAPIDEPEWPAPDDADALKKAGHAAFPGGYQFDLKQRDGSRRTGAVVTGKILLDRGLIELLGCGEGGKEHESVVRLDCDIQALDHALQLSGLKRGKLPEKLGADQPDQGARVVILLQWKKDGKTVTHRAEDIIIGSKRQKTMPRVGFTYVGTWAEVQDPASGNKKTYRVLAATGSRSLVTTYRDPSALLDNPLEDAMDDTLFAANYMLLPPSGTPVKVILRGPTADEAKEIAAIEKELSK